MFQALTHILRRKRIHQEHEKYPHPDPKKAFFDKLVYAMSLLMPIMSIPQIYKIFDQQDASSISLITFGTYLVGNFVWFTYGVIHKATPVLVANFLFGIVHVLILTGALLYG